MIAVTALLDHVYEAALLPEMWPDVLDHFSNLCGAEGGILYIVTPTRSSDGEVALSPIPRWTASERMKPFVETFIRDGWLHSNVRAERAVRLAHAGFVTDLDLFTEEEIEQHSFYKYARERGVGWHTGMTVQAPSGDVALFNFERRRTAGPVDGGTVAVLDGFKADLARAALLSSRLGLERAATMASTLALLGLPGAVLSANGAMLAANGLLEDIMPNLLTDRARSRLHLTDPRADRLFDDALARIRTPSAVSEIAAVFSIPLPPRNGSGAMVAHLIPVRRAARDVFSNAASLVLVTPVSAAEAPSASVIQGLFDLTAAEARVARRVAGGETVGEIASSCRLSEGTIRAQLKSIFAKTGVSRQVELVGLLSGINPYRRSRD